MIVSCFAMYGGIAPNKIFCSLRFFKIRKILRNYTPKWGDYIFLDFDAYPQKFADDVMTFFVKFLLSLYEKEKKISEKQREIKKTKNDIERCRKLFLQMNVNVLKNVNAYLHYIDWREVEKS